MKGVLPIAGAFLRRGLLEALSYRVAFALRLLGSGLSLASFFFMARFINASGSPYLQPYGGDYLSFGLVGLILISLQYTTVQAYPKSIRQAQIAGTLEAMLATPTPAWLVLLCEPLFEFFTAFLWAVTYLVVAGFFFGVRFDQADPLSLALALPLCGVAFASIGFFGAGLTMLLRRGDPISLSLGGLSALLGGVFYPTAVLPGPLQAAAQLLPITHALEVIRKATFAGATVSELAAPLLGLGLFSAISVPLGLLFFSWSLRRARREGSLTHY